MIPSLSLPLTLLATSSLHKARTATPPGANSRVTGSHTLWRHCRHHFICYCALAICHSRADDTAATASILDDWNIITTTRSRPPIPHRACHGFELDLILFTPCYDSTLTYTAITESERRLLDGIYIATCVRFSAWEGSWGRGGPLDLLSQGVVASCCLEGSRET